MERCYVSAEDKMAGHDLLREVRTTVDDNESLDLAFSPSRAFLAYNRIHKVLVGSATADLLNGIYNELKHQDLPDYLSAAGWAAAESALVDSNALSADRIHLINEAERLWVEALKIQEKIHASSEHEYMRQDSTPFRYARDLAFIPLLKALVLGDITSSVREATFVDVLSIAQAAGVQRHLALKAGHYDAVGDYLGFEHECNALLALLFKDDPRYIPLPSTARAGSGHDYPNQTHDIVVVNQHWGRILKAVPVEVKASASRRDIQRYDALIVRGKMHLSSNNLHSPEWIRDSFAAFYEGTPNTRDREAVYRVSDTITELLRLYQRGKRVAGQDSPTKFYSTEELIKSHPEYSLQRPQRYS